MNQELETKLRKRWPNLLNDQTSIECGDGWYDLIDLACRAINSEITSRENYEQVKYNIIVAQIKEKFGGLRFYYEGGDDTVRGMVRMAESWAGHSCETCGAPGTSGGRGWIKTLCPVHRAEADARYKERFPDEN